MYLLLSLITPIWQCQLDRSHDQNFHLETQLSDMILIVEGAHMGTLNSIIYSSHHDDSSLVTNISYNRRSGFQSFCSEDEMLIKDRVKSEGGTMVVFPQQSGLCVRGEPAEHPEEEPSWQL